VSAISKENWSCRLTGAAVATAAEVAEVAVSADVIGESRGNEIKAGSNKNGEWHRRAYPPLIWRGI
jgi:hypothetical protein